MQLVITDLRTEFGAIAGDVYVRDGGNLTLVGVIDGTLTVGVGGYAHVCGTVQHLVVRDAGGALLEGRCTGNASNLGGELTVRGGTVDGSLSGYVNTDNA